MQTLMQLKKHNLMQLMLCLTSARDQMMKVCVAFFLCMAKIATQDKKKGKDKDDKKDTVGNTCLFFQSDAVI